MNTDRILIVADAIEARKIPDLGFNMGVLMPELSCNRHDYSGNHCGSVACIAGWTILLARQHQHRRWTETAYVPMILTEAQKILELSDQQRSDLFTPFGWEISTIDDKQAVRTLRHLAETGIVDFTIGADDAC